MWAEHVAERVTCTHLHPETKWCDATHKKKKNKKQKNYNTHTHRHNVVCSFPKSNIIPPLGSAAVSRTHQFSHCFCLSLCLWLWPQHLSGPSYHSEYMYHHTVNCPLCQRYPLISTAPCPTVVPSACFFIHLPPFSLRFLLAQLWISHRNVSSVF